MVLVSPADLTLVFTRVFIGGKGLNTKVIYSRGTNCNEFISRALEGALPLTGKLLYVPNVTAVYLNGLNQQKGQERLQWSPIGCYDLPLVHKVCYGFQQCHGNHAMTHIMCCHAPLTLRLRLPCWTTRPLWDCNQVVLYVCYQSNV